MLSKVPNTSTLLGYEIYAETLREALTLSRQLIESGVRGNWYAFVNPHSLMVAEEDAYFSDALKDATVRFPDGTGIVVARRLLGRKDAGRITGFDFFRGLSEGGRDRGFRYFFLGGSEHVLDMIRARLAIEYPWVTVVGMHSPPFVGQFTQEDSAKMVRLVNEARPDVLWVGLTAPKQEKWIFEHKDRLCVPLTGAIGAVFDYYAGTRKRPAWACKLGLEWLVRLVQEPRRLWRRNVLSSPQFVWKVIQREILNIPSRYQRP